MINLDTRVLDQVNENELWLILHVAKRMKANRMTAWPSLETLSEDTKWGENTVRKWRKSLCEKGFLEIEQRTGQTPIYRFSLEGVGVYGSLSGKYEEENPYQKLVPPIESKPLPKVGTPPYQKLVPEVVSNRSILTNEVVSKEIAPQAAFITSHTPDQIENVAVRIVEGKEFSLEAEKNAIQPSSAAAPAEIQETPTSKDAGNFEANPTPQLLDLEAQSRDGQVFAAIEGKKTRTPKPAGNSTAAICAELKTQEVLDFFHAIHAAWGEWIDYKRREKKGPYKTAKTEAVTIAALAKSVNYDPEAGRAAIEHSIAHTYAGIYPPSNKGKIVNDTNVARYSLEDRPQAQTPAQMKEELGRFYTGHKDLLAEVQQTAETNYGQERLRSIVTDFCSNRIGKGRQNETFGQHHAEFGIWLKRQKEFDAKNQLTQPAGPTPQPQLRSAAPVNYSQSSPMRADKTE